MSTAVLIILVLSTLSQFSLFVYILFVIEQMKKELIKDAKIEYRNYLKHANNKSNIEKQIE